MSTHDGLKVCLIAGVIGSGGAERQLYYTIKVLREHDVDVQLLYMGDHNWSKRFQGLGIPLACVGDSSSRVTRIARIVAALRRQNAHFVQSWHFYTNLYAVAAARLVGAVEIGAVRSDAINDVRSMGRLGPLSLRLPRVVAANSRLAIENATKLGASASRMRLLPNVVDTDVFTPPATPPPDAPIRILLVGGLAPVKRADRFLSVLARVRAQTARPITGIIAGHDLQNRWPLIEQQARALGLLPDGVEFRGPTQDMAALYRDVHLVTLTSDWEGTPNAVMEAMAAGLPVVATRVGGVPDLIQDGRSGFIVDTADEDGMVHAVRRLVDDAALRASIGENARASIRTTHSLPRLFTSLIDLYQSTSGRQALCTLPS
jgi:glycosyltransferase involved in cell wall biosynthesis